MFQNKILIISICLVAILSVACMFVFGINNNFSNNMLGKSKIAQVDYYNYIVTMKRDILSLMLAYPEYITGIESKDQNVFIIMKSGNRIIYDDKKFKSADEKISDADLQDMMAYTYPIQDISKLMPVDKESGPFKVHLFFNEIYGGTANQIESNLILVKIKNKVYPFNKNANAAKALRSVMNELVPLANDRKDINKFLFPISGTYNYRTIEGTNLLSTHATGISIDLVCAEKDYWRWTSREGGQERLDIYPREIVQAFEKNNFIWGGKWGEFDLMHYDYRPELVIKARYWGAESKQGAPWYTGLPYMNQTITNYIKEIDKACDDIK